MSDDRRNIKVQPGEFEELSEEKPAGVSWGYYLTELRTLDD